jgi:hypothetical protein
MSTKPISKTRAAELVAVAYPMWTGDEIRRFLDHPELNIDLGRGRSVTAFPSAKADEQVNVVGLTYTGR